MSSLNLKLFATHAGALFLGNALGYVALELDHHWWVRPAAIILGVAVLHQLIRQAVRCCDEGSRP